jgi:hypothetical protein
MEIAYLEGIHRTVSHIIGKGGKNIQPHRQRLGVRFSYNNGTNTWEIKGRMAKVRVATKWLNDEQTNINAHMPPLEHKSSMTMGRHLSNASRDLKKADVKAIRKKERSLDNQIRLEREEIQLQQKKKEVARLQRRLRKMPDKEGKLRLKLALKKKKHSLHKQGKTTQKPRQRHVQGKFKQHSQK